MTAAIEVFADLGCPFTHVVLGWLVQRGIEPQVRAWPLEIINGRPFSPRHVAAEAAALRRDVAPDRFAGFDPERYPATTLPGMVLAAAGGLAVNLELRDLLFEQGRDVADPAVLAAVAERHGLTDVDLDDRTAVLADLAEGRARGVVGSPHLFTPNGDRFAAGLDITTDDDGDLHVEADPAAIDALLRSGKT